MFLLVLDVCVQQASATSYKVHGLQGGWTLAAVLFQDTTLSVTSRCSWLPTVTLDQEAIRVTSLVSPALSLHWALRPWGAQGQFP